MNGYIQVDINGKKVGLKFNMYAGEALTGATKLQGVGANIVRIVWAGILGNSFVKQTEPELTFEDVAEWVELLTLKGDKEGILTKVTDTFVSAEPIKILLDKGKEIENGKPDTKKKPLTGKKSTK